MSRGHPNNNAQARIIELLSTKPNKLFTSYEVMVTLGFEERQAENALYNAFRNGKIMRHIEKDPEGGYFQYAMKISSNKAAVYTPQDRGQTGGKLKKRKKGQLPTSREVRTIFAQFQNKLAEIEDLIVAVVEEREELDKTLTKIKRLTD